MDKKLKNKDWKGIFNLIFALFFSVITFIIFISLFEPRGGWLIPLILLPFVLCGSIVGILYSKEKLKIIKRTFRILFFAILACIVIFSILAFFYPIEDVGFFENISRSLGVAAYFVIIVTLVPFFIGFVSAMIVKFFSAFFKKY